MQPTTPDARIPRSPAVTWRRLRAQGVPVVVFALAVGACTWLSTRVGGTVSAVGKVTAQRVDITSPAAAVVVRLPNHTGGQWSVYEHVQSGDTIAVLEDRQRDPAKEIEVRAPISGTIVGIHCWPGQSVIPGGTIATISADYGRHLVGYLPEDSPIAAKPGMRVAVRPRTGARTTFTSEVEFVANEVEQLPRHQWAASSAPQWGVPVKIKMPNDVLLPPGSLVDLRFEPSGEK
jgi:HlyD family secretion protein